MSNNKSLNPHKIDKYNISIQNFLNKCRVGAGSTIKASHISMGSFQGKFNMDEEKYTEFMKLYSEAVSYGLSYSIAEKPKDYGPILIDIDLEKLKEDNNDERLYNDDMILQIIKLYREGIKKYLDVGDDELEVSIFEKSEPTEKPTTLKDGVHMIFHNLCVGFKIRYLIRDYVVTKATSEKMFDGFTNNINDIFDKSIVNTNYWLLYGSKKPDGKLYTLSKIFSSENEIMNISNLTIEKLIKKYSLQRKFFNEENAQVLTSEFENEDIDILYDKLNNKSNKKNLFEDIKVSENKEDDIRIATYLVSLLDSERAEKFESWIRVGWALHNIDLSLLNLWIDFSKRSPKFKNGYCEEQWIKMRNEGLSIGSLMLWAEEDNYTKYHEFINNEKKTAIQLSLSGNTYQVAKALFCIYRNRFICTDFKSSEWFEFTNHRWCRVPDGYTLRKEISETFVNEYAKLAANYNLKSITEEGENKEEMQKKASRVNKLVSDLMNVPYKNKIMEEARILFFNPEFYKLLDENYDLIGFNNGVYDLEKGEFRDGRPDDFISKSTKLDYYDYSENNPYSKLMLKFFKEILPNEEIREYVLLVLSTCISGHNKEEKFNIMTGTGSNGKSLLFLLVQLALGDYYISCPITIFTKKRNSAAQASPELARLKGVRCAALSETDEGEKLNVGVLKELTGNDTFMARGLFKDPIEIKPQCKFFLPCNEMPAVPSTDGGTWRRLLKIEFSSKFVETPTKPNEYLIDNKLKNKIKDWAPVFVSYLIYLYVTQYKSKEYLHVPKVIQCSTEEYKMENDHFTEYFISRLTVTNNKHDKISINDVFDDCKEWIKEWHSNKENKVTRPELLKFLNQTLGKIAKDKYWYGIKMNERKDESASSDDGEENNNNSALN